MKLNVYCMYDRVLEEFGPLWEAKNNKVAVRQAQKLVASPEIEADDFELVQVARFDHESGEISGMTLERVELSVKDAEDSDE